MKNGLSLLQHLPTEKLEVKETRNMTMNYDYSSLPVHDYAQPSRPQKKASNDDIVYAKSMADVITKFNPSSRFLASPLPPNKPLAGSNDQARLSYEAAIFTVAGTPV
jgi:hypothetical protein